MNYHIGDQVVHWIYGSGKIIAIEEKRLAGRSRQYYVVKADRTTLWVPVDETGEKNLRLPITHTEFLALLDLFHYSGSQMPNYSYQRRIELVQRMQRRTLVDICLIIRDLASRSRVYRLNGHDCAVLKRAKAFLLDEWERSIGISRGSAQHELESLLGDN